MHHSTACEMFSEKRLVGKPRTLHPTPPRRGEMQASCLSHKTFFAKHLTRCRVVHSCRFFQSEDIRTAAAGQANCRGVKGSGRFLTLPPGAAPSPRQRSAGRAGERAANAVAG